MTRKGVWKLQDEGCHQGRVRKVYYKFLEIWCGRTLVSSEPLYHLSYKNGCLISKTPQTLITYSA